MKDDMGNDINRSFGYGSDGKVYLWNETDTKTGLRGDLTATYTNANVGLRIRLRGDWDPKNDLKGGTIDRYAYGWLNLFSDSLKLTGGFIDLSDNVWGTLGDGDWDIGGLGLRVEFKPFNLPFLNTLNLGDFNIGAFLLVPTKDNPNTLHDEDNKEYIGYVTIERTFNEMAFGFRWTHPWFYASAQLQLDSDVDGVEIRDFRGVETWSGAADEMRFMFGAGVTLLPELKLTVEGNFEGLGNWEMRGTGDLRQTLQYKLTLVPVPYLDRIFLGVKAKELLWGYDIKKLAGWNIDLGPWMQIKPFIGYQVTEGFSACFEMGFGSGYQVYAHPRNDQQFVNEASNIYIKPNVIWALKNGFELRAWYMFTKITYDDLNATFTDRKNSYIPRKEDSSNNLVDAVVKHQVALELVWSF
jgi:hypothetical protein